uniref:Uncharacterized protein n=1 Tax=Arundo donax TaxID=35708 RepID=A0A0A9TWP8_ARUDO
MFHCLICSSHDLGLIMSRITNSFPVAITILLRHLTTAEKSPAETQELHPHK